MPSFFAKLDKRVLSNAVVFFTIWLALWAMALSDPQSAFWTGIMRDPDDFMRLDQVLAWLQGQGWYNTSQPRMGPGAGTVIHWSRLVDFPIAAFTLIFHRWMDWQGAALLAAKIVPPLLFIPLLVVMERATRILLGRGRSVLVLPFIPLVPAVVYNFTPGRVDHHGYQLIIAAWGIMALWPILFCRRGWQAAIGAGIAFALGLWIGTEAVPQLFITAAMIGVGAAWRGGYALNNAAVFGVALAVASAIILPIAVPVAEWGQWAVSWYSPSYVLLSALIAAVFIIAARLLPRMPVPALRVGVMVKFAILAAVFFVVIVPKILKGPFADYHLFNATTDLDNIIEAQPLWHVLRARADNDFTIITAVAAFVRYFLPALLVAAGCLWGMVKSPSPRRRMVLGMFFILITGMFMLTLFGQIRVERFVDIYMLPALVWAIVVMPGMWRKSLSSSRHALISFTVFFFALLAPMLAPAIVSTSLLPGGQTSSKQCDMRGVVDYLTTTDFVLRPIVLMATYNEGPELLFRTPHSVIGGNYDVPSNPDVYGFFSARDEQKASAIAHKWNASMVLMCRNYSTMFVRLGPIKFGENAFLAKGKDGKLSIKSSLDHPTLAERLAGGDVPSWLNPVEIPGNKDYLLFTVQPDIAGVPQR